MKAGIQNGRAGAAGHRRLWRYTMGALVGVLLLLLVFVAGSRRAGRLNEPTLSGSRLAAVNEIEIRMADGVFVRLNKDGAGQWRAVCEQGTFEPDASRIEDLLAVFNLWEIAFIPTDSQASAWREMMEKEGGYVRLQAGIRTFVKLQFVYRESLFMVRQGRHFYAMQSPWQPASWPKLFAAEPGAWQSRAVWDLDYLQIKRVKVRYAGADSLSYCLKRLDDGTFRIDDAAGVSDTVDAAVARAYLAAFKGVYFDASSLRTVRGKPLYDIEVEAGDGRFFALSVFEKQTEEGLPDLFKAVVVRPRQTAADTVELSYAVLDKMAKTRDWFYVR